MTVEELVELFTPSYMGNQFPCKVCCGGKCPARSRTDCKGIIKYYLNSEVEL